ncbi:transposase [Streptomyces sp. NPDC001634]|uniref:transposase n=1 Tax=Streptomyces sp. NPDC001634 TaxID=3154390 RepID=UPI00331C5A8B
MRANGKGLRVNIMSAVASRGALWFTVFTSRFTAKVFTGFPDRLARQAGRKVHVIADRHPVHRCKAVRTWLDENTSEIGHRSARRRRPDGGRASVPEFVNARSAQAVSACAVRCPLHGVFRFSSRPGGGPAAHERHEKSRTLITPLRQSAVPAEHPGRRACPGRSARRSGPGAGPRR